MVDEMDSAGVLEEDSDEGAEGLGNVAECGIIKIISSTVSSTDSEDFDAPAMFTRASPDFPVASGLCAVSDRIVVSAGNWPSQAAMSSGPDAKLSLCARS